MKSNLSSSRSPLAIIVTADDGGTGKTTFVVQAATDRVQAQQLPS